MKVNITTNLVLVKLNVPQLFDWSSCLIFAMYRHIYCDKFNHSVNIQLHEKL